MKKKLMCMLLCLGLCLPLAQAANFPVVNTYPGFADVSEGDWFYANARLCSEVGLMNGTDKGFEPQKPLSVAECAAVASRIRETLTGTPIPANTSGLWYQNYLDYMLSADGSLAPILAAPESPSTRMQYLLLLGAALPQGGDVLGAINSITTLPDTDNSVVLAFYNAGVLTGVDDYGTFDGDKPLSRAECAAMVSRVIQPELRVSFTPKEHAHLPSGSGETHDTTHGGGTHDTTHSEPHDTAQSGGSTPAIDADVAMIVNGQSISRTGFVNILNSVIYDEENNLYKQTGQELDWDADYGVGDLSDYFLSRAINETVTYAILSSWTNQLGCTMEDLPTVLFPNPSHSDLQAAVQKYDLLCAKHILVDSLDTANAIIGGLDAAPTMTQFDALLSIFGTDPGMEQNPDGYLFLPGEMVSEFEAGTRALNIGSYSPQPVQSDYGYHIIWRLDPADHPDFLAQYQQTMTVEILNSWIDEAEVTLNEELIFSIDPKASYLALWLN